MKSIQLINEIEHALEIVRKYNLNLDKITNTSISEIESIKALIHYDTATSTLKCKYKGCEECLMGMLPNTEFSQNEDIYSCYIILRLICSITDTAKHDHVNNLVSELIDELKVLMKE